MYYYIIYINVEQILLTNICHSYHGCCENVLVTRGKMVTVRDTIFQNLYFQNFSFLFSVRALIMKVQSNKSVYQSKELSKYIFRCYGKFAFTSE